MNFTIRRSCCRKADEARPATDAPELRNAPVMFIVGTPKSAIADGLPGRRMAMLSNPFAAANTDHAHARDDGKRRFGRVRTVGCAVSGLARHGATY
jgi:hypothetical protein